MSTFREELEKLGNKELNEVEQKLVENIKEQVREYVTEHGLNGQFRCEVKVEEADISKIRSNVVNHYMHMEGLPSFTGGMMTNVINTMFDNIFFGTPTTIVVYFAYKVRF